VDFQAPIPKHDLQQGYDANGQRREIIKQLEVRRSLAAFPFLQFILVRVDICE
jgi:hypothetical protein